MLFCWPDGESGYCFLFVRGGREGDGLWGFELEGDGWEKLTVLATTNSAFEYEEKSDIVAKDATQKREEGRILSESDSENE